MSTAETEQQPTGTALTVVEPAPAPDSYAGADAAHRAAAARWREVEAKGEALRSAQLARRLVKGDSDREKHALIIARAEPFADLTDRALQRRVEDFADIELPAARKAWLAAVDTYEKARRREARRLAAALVPRHRLAVQRLVAAAEELSRAIAGEQSVRAEYADACSFQTTHALLPNASAGLPGTLAMPDSDLSHWVRRIRDLGFLER
ncbi:MAG: hypothetical protein RIM84_20965 [Alphaproteobacteria bacterium]